MYPFSIYNSNGTGYLYTQTAGTYTLKIEEEQSGGSSDLNNPIQLELEDDGNDHLVTVLSAGEIYALCQTGTPFFTVTAEQLSTYQEQYKPDTKYFINEYYYDDSDEVAFVGLRFVMLGIADTSNETVRTMYDILTDPVETSYHLIIAGEA